MELGIRTRDEDGAINQVIGHALDRARLLLAALLLLQVLLPSEDALLQFAVDLRAVVGIGALVQILAVARRIWSTQSETPELVAGSAWPAIVADVAVASLLLVLTNEVLGLLVWLAVGVPVLATAYTVGLGAAVAIGLAISGFYLAARIGRGGPGESGTDAIVLGLQQLVVFLAIILAVSTIIRFVQSHLMRTEAALARSNRLARQLDGAARVARTMTDLASANDVLECAVESIEQLGFSYAELVVERPTGWRVEHALSRSTGSLPPGEVGTTEALRTKGVVRLSGNDSTALAQQMHQLARGDLLAVELSPLHGSRMVLRAWRPSHAPRTTEADVEVVDLYAKQVNTALQAATQFSDLERRSRELADQANHDQLTGLPNRHALFAHLEGVLERGHPAALLFCDLNGFKAANDVHGHEAGDLVLCEVGQRFREAMVDRYFVSRLGGDEFVIAIGGDGIEFDQTDLEHAANGLIACLEAPFAIAGAEIPIGTSVGVAMSEPGDEAETLLRRADQAMYVAKRGGEAISHS